MGMYVSQLRSVPVGVYKYYVYLIDASTSKTHAHEVDRFFDGFAKGSGAESVIVRGPQDLSWQLFQFLLDHVKGDFRLLENLFHETTCLLVSEGTVQETKKPIFVLPLRLAHNENPDEFDLSQAILISMLRAMAEERLAEFVQSLGAVQVELSEIKDGMLIATLRHANEILELKPNAAGLGLNLNAVIQKVLGSAQRQLPG